MFSESEWVPVIPKKPEPKKLFVPASTNDQPVVPPPLIQPPIQPAPTTVFPVTTEVKKSYIYVCVCVHDCYKVVISL